MSGSSRYAKAKTQVRLLCKEDYGMCLAGLVKYAAGENEFYGQEELQIDQP